MRNLNRHSANIATGFVLGAAGLLLGGCSLQPVNPVNMTTYALDVEVQFEPAAAGTGVKTLLVNTPSAQPGFNTPRMVYLKRPQEIEYFSRNQWVDSPARMLTPLLIQALERSGKYRAVVHARSAAMADIRLDTEIIRLQHEFLTLPSKIRLTVRAQLIDLNGKRVLATREFDVTEVATGDDPYSGVTATNRAVKVMLLQLVDFCALESKAVEPRTMPR
jgi:cholesterol transport system auxiliary component